MSSRRPMMELSLAFPDTCVYERVCGIQTSIEPVEYVASTRYHLMCVMHVLIPDVRTIYLSGVHTVLRYKLIYFMQRIDRSVPLNRREYFIDIFFAKDIRMLRLLDAWTLFPAPSVHLYIDIYLVSKRR